MRTYHKDIAGALFPLFLAALLAGVAFWIRDHRVFWLVAVFCYAAFFELASKVTVSEQEIGVVVGFFPFLPAWRKTILWSDVNMVQAFHVPIFVETDALIITARSHERKKQQLFIPIAGLAHRHEFLEQLSTFLPSNVRLSSDVLRWAETVGTTPKWQLGVAFIVLLLLAGIAWFFSFRPLP